MNHHPLPLPLDSFEGSARTAPPSPEVSEALLATVAELRRVSAALRLLAVLDSIHEVMWMQAVLELVLPKDLRAAFEARKLPEASPNWTPLLANALKRGRWGENHDPRMILEWVRVVAENARVTPVEILLDVLRARDLRGPAKPSEARAQKPLSVREIAGRISAHLQRFERDPKINTPVPPHTISPYYRAGTGVSGRFVQVYYVNFQGKHNLTREEALRYLAWLDAGNEGKHFKALRETAPGTGNAPPETVVTKA